jgi:N-methylhydantoinase B
VCSSDLVIRAWQDIRPGDVFIHNDPYFGGAHLPDVNVVTPIFSADTPLGFACVRAHWPDIGGAAPGSYATTTEIFGEGLRMPPIRLCKAGEVNRDIESIIFANVRVAEERRGDLRAQIAANHRAEIRVQALAAKHGPETLVRIMAEIQDRSEQMMRQAIAGLPDGVASFEAHADGDGIADNEAGEDAQIRFQMSVTIAGDELSVDMTGSESQVAGPMNAPLAVTASGVYTAVKMVADPDNLIPPNSGCWRPISVTAPEGTVANATYPAPVVYANHEVAHLVCEMFFGALAEIVPDRVMACSNATGGILTIGGVDHRTGRRYVSYENVKGGMGARPTKDGINGIYTGISNGMNVPVEILETSFPVEVERYEIVPDSGGAGRYRGGCGVLRVWRLLGPGAEANVCCERTVSPPFGLFGAGDGGTGEVALVLPDGTRRVLNSKATFKVPEGVAIWFRRSEEHTSELQSH